MHKVLFSLMLTSSLIIADAQRELGDLAQKYLGGEYVWGGETPKGFDCSGYTQYIFNKVGIELPRTAYEQSKVGRAVQGSLQRGDLLFFNTDPTRGIPVTHVGVYLENGKFIHAAGRKKGIIISPLTKKYQRTYLGAKRVLQRQEANNKPIELPKDFFTPYKKALVAPTKVTLTYDFYRIYKGQYLRESDIKELEKMEKLKSQTDTNNVIKKIDPEIQKKIQQELKDKIHQKRVTALPITYSAKEAEELGAFEERALSEEDALEAIDESN